MDEGLPPSLEHPLPAGMRDLLADEAASRRRIARAVQECFALHGYRVVTPPAFELADVVERGLGTLTASDVLRFIEPGSGEVAVLRPDLTPQIARIVATRLRDHAPPYRLAYEGTVVRRKLGRAKKHRQIPQVGVELCGVDAADGDLELLSLAVAALRAAGLETFTIDLADAGIVRELLAGAPPERARAVTSALARKDDTLLADAVQGLAGGSRLRALAQLHGGRDALVEACALLAPTRAARSADRLLSLYDAAVARGLGPHLVADAGEVRGFAYYTGTLFSLYAPGPGDALGGGGRYDELLARFGRAMPAAGFGLDLDALAVALLTAGAAAPPASGVVVVGPPDDARVVALRAAGVASVSIASVDAARAHARSWGFALVWSEGTLEAIGSGAKAAVTGNVEEAAREAVCVLESLSRGA